MIAREVNFNEMQTRPESLSVPRFEVQPYSMKHERAQPRFMKKELDWADSDLRNSKGVEDPTGMVADPDLLKPARECRNTGSKMREHVSLKSRAGRIMIMEAVLHLHQWRMYQVLWFMKAYSRYMAPRKPQSTTFCHWSPCYRYILTQSSVMCNLTLHMWTEMCRLTLHVWSAIHNFLRTQQRPCEIFCSKSLRMHCKSCSLTNNLLRKFLSRNTRNRVIYTL